jgi:DNA-binding transcriptional MerR regulator
MAELSAASGVPVATVKYYLREGLLQPGERTSPNQARYSEGHVQRLKLIRALLDVGGLSVATVGEVLSAVDSGAPTHNVLGLAQKVLSGSAKDVDEQSHAWALDVLEDLAARHGWKVEPEDPTVSALIVTLCAVRDLSQGHDGLLARLDDYATLADRTAEVDLDTVASLPSLDRIVEAAVIGTVLGDRLFSALRRLAQSAESGRRFLPDA